MEFLTAYGPKEKVQTHPIGKSRTKQSFADETNINNILKKYDQETIAEQMLKNPGQFLDLPSGLDYQLAMNLAIAAKESFDALPGTLRATFGNDAEKFLDFMEDPDNETEIVEMGLREAPPVDPTAAPTEAAPLVESAPNIEPSTE